MVGQGIGWVWCVCDILGSTFPRSQKNLIEIRLVYTIGCHELVHINQHNFDMER